MERKFVTADLYDKDYYLTDCDGFEEYKEGKLNLERHKRVISYANLKKGDRVLDIGCGRGELAYQCVLRGCKVTGIDYSKDALELAKKTLERLPNRLRKNVKLKQMDVVNLNLDDKFDVIFMVDLVEHLYDWQLEELFFKIKENLSNKAKIIIQTPNLNYDRFLFPLKKIFSLPITILKQFSRLLRGNVKNATLEEWLKYTFKIFPPKSRSGEPLDLRHVNVHTPGQLKELLSDYKTDIFCVDYSKNIISLIFRRWWGRKIVVIAKL